MAQQIFSGVIVASGTNTPNAVALPVKAANLSLALNSAFSATAATTGAKVQIAVSIDSGLTYSDFADVVTTAPTPSQVSAQSSQKFAQLAAYVGATHVKFKILNLDATNAATCTLNLRTAP